ncbi:hypothetical protein M7784_14915 [Desulfovibrio aminophilus]|nr:hypothetical protein [Desulfovibrio aminophilus]MCM0756525.1 hypothetical protein [Desulfovibrio aminophilus]
MSLHLRCVTVAAAGVALLGMAVCAAARSEALRPVMVGAVRGGMKAADWVGGKTAEVRKGLRSLADEARKPAVKGKAKAKA